MQIDEIRLAILRARTDISAEGVAHLSLFGSRVRGDFRAESDLDVLIETDPSAKFSVLNLIGVEQIISRLTGLHANAFMQRSMDAGFQKQIAPDVLEVF